MVQGHTPGPWEIRQGDVNIRIQNQDDPVLPTTIAMVFSRDPNGNRLLSYRTNAHLIAAAPDLLAACEAYLEAQAKIDALRGQFKDRHEDPAVQSEWMAAHASVVVTEIMPAEEAMRAAVAKARAAD